MTLINYGNFANPECARTHQAVRKVQRVMGKRLRYVFRSFPEPERFAGSEAAAEAAECASAQGKFWEMHDRMFEDHGASDELNLTRYASDVGLDLKQYRGEMGSHAHLPRVRATRREAVRKGVVQAPAFFINSRRHRSAFGLATLLPAVQAAAGGA